MTFKKFKPEYQKYGEAAQIISDLFNNFPDIEQYSDMFYAPPEIIQNIISKNPLDTKALDRNLTEAIEPLTYYYLATQYMFPLSQSHRDKLIEITPDVDAELLLKSPHMRAQHLDKCFETFKNRYQYSIPLILKQSEEKIRPLVLQYMVSNLSKETLLQYKALPYQYVDTRGQKDLVAILQEKIEETTDTKILATIANNKTLPAEIRKEALMEGADFTESLPLNADRFSPVSPLRVSTCLRTSLCFARKHGDERGN